MRSSLEIFIAIVGALLISRLFEDSEMAFVLLFIAIQSIIQLVSGKRKIEINMKKSKKLYIFLGLGILIGIAGTLINYFISKNTWLGIISAAILAVSMSTACTNFILICVGKCSKLE